MKSPSMWSLPNRTKNVFKAILVCGFAGGNLVYAQLSAVAYRVLGQTEFRQRGVNMVQGVELYRPWGIALDRRDGQIHLYISDSGNSRVLAWRDMNSYQTGDP